MTDFNLVEPRGWEYDLQSVYSAYIGYFQVHNISWYERSWGHFFASFDEFLSFSWPVITVTDAWTGRAHIVTRMTSIGAFLKMIKTRFGETLPVVDNMLKITPFETTQRHLRTISDWQSYKKVHSTLPAAVLASLKARVKAGEPKAIQNLWAKRDKTFLAIDFEWSERNKSSALEWGYAAVRCGHLEAQGHWPPIPDTNYRKGHYIVAEFVDRVINKHCPTHPWKYGFADSQVTPKAKLPQIIQAIVSSLASPDSETSPNNLVLVGHGLSKDLNRLEEMKIRIPHNTLTIDTAAYERSLFSAGLRGIVPDPKTNKPRAPGTTLSLENLIRSFNADIPCYFHNAGNDALLCLFALQKLLDPDNTPVPVVKKNRLGAQGLAPGMGMNMMPGAAPAGGMIPPVLYTGYVAPRPMSIPVPVPMPLPMSLTAPAAMAITGSMLSPHDQGESVNEYGHVKRTPGRRRALSPAPNASAAKGNGKTAKNLEQNGDTLGAAVKSMTLK